MTRTRLISALLCAGITASTATLYASAPCRKLAYTTVQRIIPNRVSKAVLARWAAWGKDHPNWRPHGHRPKFRTVTVQVPLYDAVACELPFSPADVPLFLSPVPLPELPVDAPDITVALIPPIAESAPAVATAVYPRAPIYYGPGVIAGGYPERRRHHRHEHPPAQTPEPSTEILLFTGIASLLVIRKGKQ